MGNTGYHDNPGNVLGANTANNLFSSTNVAANKDGSMIERQEYLISTLVGTKVTRAAADIFDGTQKALFTVAGGKVLVTAVAIEVTTAAIDATASNTKLMTNPTVGTDADMCATLDITGDEAGTIYSVTGEPATALTGGSGGGANTMISPWIVPEGTIDISSSANAGTGGALGYCEIWYIPLDAGATITAA